MTISDLEIKIQNQIWFPKLKIKIKFAKSNSN